MTFVREGDGYSRADGPKSEEKREGKRSDAVSLSLVMVIVSML